MIKLKFNSITKKIEYDRVEEKEKSTPITKGVDNILKYNGITIHRHKTCNTWYTRYRYNGKQYCISAKTQQECYNKLKNALKDIENNKPKNIYTLQTWFNKWLELFKKDLRASTKRDYNNLFNLVSSKTKNKILSKIEFLELQEIINNVKAERQRQKLFILLNAIFKKANNFNLIKQNPFNYIEKPKHKKVHGKAFLEEEQEILIKYARDNNIDWFLILIYQGLRRGELLGLTGNDIDFENKTLNINKAWNEKGNIGETKNDYSNRVIPIFESVLPILNKYKNYNEKRLFEFSMTTIHRKFKDLLKNCNINNNYKIHDTRHTFVTNCKNLNIPEHIIQNWVGHNIGSSVTSSVYTHVTNDKKEQMKLSEFYSNFTQKKED